MKKHLKLRKDENLSQWLERLSTYYDNNEVSTKDFLEILREVSVQSYIAGSNAMASRTNGFTRR
jgi:hypothetical protein